jgi:hypothetical protein
MSPWYSAPPFIGVAGPQSRNQAHDIEARLFVFRIFAHEPSRPTEMTDFAFLPAKRLPEPNGSSRGERLFGAAGKVCPSATSADAKVAILGGGAAGESVAYRRIHAGDWSLEQGSMEDPGGVAV